MSKGVRYVAAFAMLFLLVTAATGAAAPANIQYAYWGDQNEETSTLALLKAFMDKNPGIQVDGVRFGTNTEFNDKITTLAAAGTLPDVSVFYEPNVLTWGMAGKFVDLTDFYRKGPAKLDAIKFITPDGKIVGVSVANEVQVIWYNKKIFDDAHLPYPPAEASKAWTWDQFVAVSKKLTRDANGKTPNDAGFDPANIRTFGAWVQQWWMPWLTFAAANGGGLTTPDGKKLILDSPATIDAIQKMADLINVHHVSPTPGTQQIPTAAATALLSGQVAMAMDGTWDLLSIGTTKDQQGLDFGIGVLPKMKTLATTSVGTPEVVYKSTKNLDASLTLLRFLMDPNSSLPLLQNGIWLPNEKQWYTDKALLDRWIGNPRHPPEYKTAVVDFALNYSHQLPLYIVPTFAKMDDVIEAALGQVWLGQKSANDVIKNEIMPKITPIFQGK
ncbi:MAG TPA: sugar ABC transporter substrate-binding protein [Spirochaetia bacterium]|nr:sugar ABC transporter substrate-binding protein [Spirochaetia bacterium]